MKGGSTLVLQVNVSGIPSPKISWFLDDEPLEKSERISVDTTDDFSTLTIKNAMLDDSGMYTIAAENVVGKAEADFEVNVKGEDKQKVPVLSVHEIRSLSFVNMEGKCVFSL